MISILFTQENSIYESLLQDCWNKKRDATKWPGGNALIAHPPCGHWGQYAHKCKQPIQEKQHAILALNQINKWGGILEHPKTSKLWQQKDLDFTKGFIWSIDQHWFGHQAKKPTYLYIVGIKPNEIPPYPIRLWQKSKKTIETMSKHQRESTPPDLAEWLIRCCYIIELNQKNQNNEYTPNTNTRSRNEINESRQQRLI